MDDPQQVWETRGKMMQAVNAPQRRTQRITQIEQCASAERAFALGFLLCVLQAADGWLTSLGMARFGTSMEGNPLLRELMETFGHVPTLTLVKVFAIAVIVLLTIQAKRLPWINNAMGALSCIYLFVAIVPWTYILFIKPYFA